MKCLLTNSCCHKNWCCNFCTLKCSNRCKDKHNDCKWFMDEPVSETDDKGNIRFFKYVLENGTYVRRYYSLEELIAQCKNNDKTTIAGVCVEEREVLSWERGFHNE